MLTTSARSFTWRSISLGPTGLRSPFLAANPKNSWPKWFRARLRSAKVQRERKLTHGLRQTFVSAMVSAATYLVGPLRTAGQAESAQKPLMAEQYFKNVQVLRG